jgi:hypothetical protein
MLFIIHLFEDRKSRWRLKTAVLAPGRMHPSRHPHLHSISHAHVGARVVRTSLTPPDPT